MGINNVILRQIITTVGLEVCQGTRVLITTRLMMTTPMMGMVMMMIMIMTTPMTLVFLMMMVSCEKCYPDNYGMQKCAYALRS